MLLQMVLPLLAMADTDSSSSDIASSRQSDSYGAPYAPPEQYQVNGTLMGEHLPYFAPTPSSKRYIWLCRIRVSFALFDVYITYPLHYSIFGKHSFTFQNIGDTVLATIAWT